MTVSNIGMRTNLINPIWAVGLVTLSLSMKGATGRPSDFSLSLLKPKHCHLVHRSQLSLKADNLVEVLWVESPAWSTLLVNSPPMAQQLRLASPHWKYHSTWSKPSSAEKTNINMHTQYAKKPIPWLQSNLLQSKSLSYRVYWNSLSQLH